MTTATQTTPWTLTRTVGPSQRIVSVAEAKTNMRLPQADTTHDQAIADQIDAATEQLEQDIDRVLITQTFVLSLNAFPCKSAPIAISNKPVQSITSIMYEDSNGTTQELDVGNYALDLGRRQIYLPAGQSWPATVSVQNAVRVTYVAGYGDSSGDVPRLTRQAVLLQVGRWFIDPMMESSESYTTDAAYERIVQKLIRTSYP